MTGISRPKSMPLYMAKVSLRLKPREMSSLRIASDTPTWYFMCLSAQALSMP